MAKAAKKKSEPNIIFKCCICHKFAFIWMQYCPGCGELATFDEVDRDAAVASGELNLEEMVERIQAEADADANDPDGDDDGDDNDGDGDGHENAPPLLVPIGDVDSTEPPRFSSGDSGLDHVLGSGLVPGSIVAIYGPPGIGKSSLTTIVASTVANRDNVIYAAGEESASRVARRVRRLKLFKRFPNARQNMTVMENANDTDVLCGLIIQESPLLTIIDSFASLESERATGRPGGPSQVAYAAKLLADVARTTGRSIVAIGHETKDGRMAGPSIARHEVDTLLAMEHVEMLKDGTAGKKSEIQTGWVRLRADGKNRDGDTNATAIYRMTDRGLIGLQELQAMIENGEYDGDSEIGSDGHHETGRGAKNRKHARKSNGSESAKSTRQKAPAVRVERSIRPKAPRGEHPVRPQPKRSRSTENAARP